MSKSLTKGLWDDAQEVVVNCLQHPFVQGLQTGELPESQFRFYVAQDAFFLEAFVRAYAIAAAKAPTWQNCQQLLALGQGVVTELELHRRYAEKWNIDLFSVNPAIATQRYTDFLLSTAWSSPAGVTALAMTPCMRLYAYLGQTLNKTEHDHDYSDWIRTYSDPAFEELAQTLEAFCDRVNGPALCERFSQVYNYALDCELAFFEAATKSQG